MILETARRFCALFPKKRTFIPRLEFATVFAYMSRSTPLNQLPQPSQAGVLGDMPEDDSAIQAVANEIRHSALVQQQLQQQQQYPASSLFDGGGVIAAAPAPVSRGGDGLNSPDVKLALLILIFFALFGNDMVATMLAERVPGMSNPWVSLLVRGAAMAALVVVINRVFS